MESQWQIWTLSEEEKLLCDSLSKTLNISPSAAKLLIRRGILTPEQAHDYIRPSLADLPDPFLMRDMDKAVERLSNAVDRKENILIYGDYDVDGTTAVALAYSFLKNITDRLSFYIPERNTEGYGISYKGIQYAKEHGCTLVVALDCGITEVEKIKYASEQKIDFIVCDHHTPGDVLPQAVAVLNMKRKDCPYPFKDLSGCGVGMKLMQALARHRGIPEERWQVLLPLLAMSIAADLVSVTGENRIFAYYGLRHMNNHPGVAIRSLLKKAGLEGKKVTMSDLGFKICPRINACGRLHTGTAAVELLLTTSEQEAEKRVTEIDQYNSERQKLQVEVVNQALASLQADPDNDTKCSTVAYSPNWHKGVVGLAASSLISTYYRPTVVLTKGEGNIISGSARSVGTFDLYAALYSCRDLLLNFGGHKFAAGLCLSEDNLEPFKQRFEAYVATHILPEQRQPVIPIEQEISLGEIDDTFFNVLRHLAPFGQGNPEPVFCTRHVINHRYTRSVGKENEHLHLDVTDQSAAIEGIAFWKGDWARYLQNGNPVDLCYILEENTFRNKTTIQMVVEDIRKAE